MLFTYPIAATANNWLHDSLYIMLGEIHDAASNGQALPTWEHLVFVSRRKELSRRTGLRDRLATYQKAFSALSRADRARVGNALAQQNAIQELLECRAECDVVSSLPQAIQ